MLDMYVSSTPAEQTLHGEKLGYLALSVPHLISRVVTKHPAIMVHSRTGPAY